MNDINVIEVDGLTKYYPEVQAVNRISFKVRQGQVVGFLGPNGAGKTTTLKMLTCFLPPTSGEARVAGHSISSDPTAVRRSIGYLPEHNALYDEMRVEEYLRFRATLKGVPWRLRQRYVQEAMDLCRLGDVKERIVSQLSKGYRQRVGLADTLVHKPPVLIFDEPTVGLDPAQIIEVRELIKQLARNNTVLLSTHYLAEVEQICDHVVIIFEGEIVASDSLESMKRGPDGEVEDLETVFMRLTSEAAKNKEKKQAEKKKQADENEPESKKVGGQGGEGESGEGKSGEGEKRAGDEERGEPGREEAGKHEAGEDKDESNDEEAGR
jgi:ABC-2 type transport system ATP-binding protein